MARSQKLFRYFSQPLSGASSKWKSVFRRWHRSHHASYRANDVPSVARTVGNVTPFHSAVGDADPVAPNRTGPAPVLPRIGRTGSAPGRRNAAARRSLPVPLSMARPDGTRPAPPDVFRRQENLTGTYRMHPLAAGHLIRPVQYDRGEIGGANSRRLSRRRSVSPVGVAAACHKGTDLVHIRNGL